MVKRGPPGAESVPIDKYRKSIGKQNEVWTSKRSIKRQYVIQRRQDEQGSEGTSSKKSKKGAELQSTLWKVLSTGTVLITLGVLVYYMFALVLLPKRTN